jgi:hypothetical protein
MNALKGFALAATSAMLVACGGGGSSTDNPITPVVKAEGAWQGTTSTGYALNVLVLENNEVWAIFGTLINDFFTVYGFDRGTGIQSGSNLTGSGTEYSFDGSAVRGAFSMNVVPGVSLNGTVTGAQQVSISTTPLKTNYDYNSPANIATVAGTWNGQLINGSATSVSISSTGIVSGTNAGCSFVGTTTPRASGKNVFNVTLTFGRSPCVSPNQSVSGIGIAYPTAKGKTQLMVAVTDAANTSGTIFFAQR